MRAFHAYVVLSLAASTAAARPESAGRGRDVPVSLSSAGAIRVPVEIDGRGPFQFLLDTGSTHTAVGSELAERLSLPVVARTRVLTPAGTETALVVRVERVVIGSASVSGLTPSVVSLAELRRIEPGIDGVIGQDFLLAFDFTVDYRRKRLRWTAALDGVQQRLPLVRSGGRALVQLADGRSGAPVLMVPDTGSGGLVLFERDGRTALTLEDADATVAVSGLSSSLAARGALLRELKVGGVTLRDQPAVVIPRSGSRAVEGDGLLPLHTFASVSFSNSEGYLVVRR
jgi:predicted aspartyl protease